MIYLDNAATSYPKPSVVCDEMINCMKNYCANPGRGGHQLSIKSSDEVFNAREVTSRFFHIKNPLNLMFTKNATESLNIAIKGVLCRGDHVITTCMEHNSVIRPIKRLEKELDIELTIVQGDEYGEIKAENIEKEIKGNTKLIVMTLSSNVNGIIMPIKEIGDLAKAKNIYFLLDASQGAGCIDIDVNKMNISMLAFPGHKGLLGPQGTGGLYVNSGIPIKSIIEGGTGSSSENLYQPDLFPDLLESGTLNTPGIVGLCKGIEFINQVGVEKIRHKKHKLIQKIFTETKKIDNIKIYSKNDINKNSGIFAFNFIDVDSTEVSYVLDKVYNICVRAGLHCAPLAHKEFGTLKTGIVRASIGYFNEEKEIDIFLEALVEISKNT